VAFPPGLCCIAAASPQTLCRVFPDDETTRGSGDGEGDGAGGGTGAQGEEASRPRAPQGLINVSLFRDGFWVTTQVDDRVPCSRSGELLVPHCESYEEGMGKLWMAVAEKALAGLIGGYDKFGGIKKVEDVPSALVMLTGGQVKTLDLTSSESLMWLQNGYLWSSLKSWCARGGTVERVVVCLTHSSSKERYGFSDGLARNLAYPVIEVGEMKQGAGRHGCGRLVRLWNPWGDAAEWRGAMANGSPELDALRLKEEKSPSFDRARLSANFAGADAGAVSTLNL